MYSSLLSTQPSTVKSRQISNILTHGFLWKWKKQFNFANGPIKISEITIKAVSWNYCAMYVLAANTCKHILYFHQDMGSKLRKVKV